MGDLYRAIDLRFIDPQTGGQGGFDVNDVLQFRQDTDTVGGRQPNGDGSEGDPIPEPATMLLLGMACVGLVPAVRKRLKKA